MRDYPIGSFLFWKLGAEAQAAHPVYGFIQHYHEKDFRHCPELTDVPPSDDRFAILDGQQRLTSLYVGLIGSYAERLPRAWWNNPNAFPSKYLYLDLAEAPPTEDEAGAEGETGDIDEYTLRFKTPEQVEEENANGAFWFRVSRMFELEEAFDIVTLLQDIERANDKHASRLLHRLFKVVHDEQVINYYLEEAQDIDKVLNIFIRVNAQGTPLSFSDLLLSVATAKWVQRDARKEIYELVDRLNSTGHGFAISKDLVMKSCLVLTDAPSIRFQVSSFTEQRMTAIEDQWPEIVSALEVSTRLLADFGLSAPSLTANSVLIPIAYYLKFRGLDDAYRASTQNRDDLDRIREWTLRSLLKQGIWGSGLDTLLTNIRGAIRDHGATGFALEPIEAAMAKTGKSLEFTPADLDLLADVQYGDRRTFGVLTLLYPSVDARNLFHVDHVFPRALLAAKKLKKEGLDDAAIREIMDATNGLGNLQLLPGPHNLEKSDGPPKKWLEKRFPDEEARNAYAALYDLGGLSDDAKSFPAFYAARRSSLRRRLGKILGVPEETERLDSSLVRPTEHL